jgi:hypothetical protein
MFADRLCRDLLLGILIVASPAAAQQTIINVPSDALTPPGQLFTLHETQLAPVSEKATFATTNFLTYGLTKHTELAATLYGVDNEGSHLSALGLGFKSTYDVLQEPLPESEVKWTLGFMMPISTGTAADRVGYFPYSHVTFQMPSTKLRLLAGGAAGSKNLFGENTLSALAGAEYPLTEHLSFTGEWFSGRHELAGLIPGLTYHNRRLIVVMGYKIPNNFQLRESGLVMEAGWFFGGGAKSSEHQKGDHYGLHLP